MCNLLPIAAHRVIHAGVTRMVNSVQDTGKVPLGDILKNSLSNKRIKMRNFYDGHEHVHVVIVLDQGSSLQLLEPSALDISPLHAEQGDPKAQLRTCVYSTVLTPDRLGLFLATGVEWVVVARLGPPNLDRHGGCRGGRANILGSPMT